MLICEENMNIHSTPDKRQINIIFSMNGEPLDIIIVDIYLTINECFNKLIREGFHDRLKETDIKIIYNSSIIYSYYDQTIGDKPIKDLFENNIEINVSLLFTDTFIYISNEIRLNYDEMIGFNTIDGTTGCHEESYWNLSDRKKVIVDQILESFHDCSFFCYYEIYNNIIKTKFIIGILLKNNRKYYSHILLNQKNENFNNDKETIEILIKYCSGLFLEFASTELRANKEIVEMAISSFGVSIQFASTELRENRELVIKAVSQDGRALQYVPNHFKGDIEIVEIALITHGFAIRYASTELKVNRELAKKAVSQNGLAIRFLSNELQSDKEITKIAINENPMAVKFASYELQSEDKEIFKIAFHINKYSLYYASKNLQADRDIVKLVVSKCGWELEYASRELRADREIVEIAVSNYGFSLQFATLKLRADKEIVEIAVSNYGSSLRFASYNLRADKEIIKIAINQYGGALEHASLESLRNDRELLDLSYNNRY